MKKEKPTIHVIARELNINSSTVSRALNDSPRVKASTKKRIIDKAEELGYQPNFIASNLRRSKSNTIGVVVPRISRHFFSTAISGIEEVAYAYGFNVVICQSLESLKREQKIINNLISSRVDGVLISVTMETTDHSHLLHLQKSGVPLVFFDRHCNGMKNSNRVIIDDETAAFKAVSHLIQKGCKRIAHFSGPQSLEIYKNRFKGYKRALKEYGLTYEKDLVFGSRLMELDGYKVAKVIAEDKIMLDGLFASNDVSAIGAMRYFLANGYRIPEDVAVVGFSNEPTSEVIHPGLTTIDQKAFTIGEMACNLLIGNIKDPEKENQGKTILVNSDLLERESSCFKDIR